MSHDGRAGHDAARTAFLERQALRVIRVSNDDVLCDMDAVLRAILFARGVDPDGGAKL